MKKVFFITMTVVFALVGIVWASMRDYTTAGWAFVLALVCAYWAIRKNK